MEAADACTLLHALDQRGVAFWLDGGWGVDCLLGEVTRQHSDLELVVARTDVDRVHALLTARGYTVIRDWLPTSIAFRDDAGREVDLHPVDLTEDGGGDQVLEDGTSWHYSAPVEGSIAGRPVRCASAQDQLSMHVGYETRPVDVADVGRIAARFDLPLPPGFDDTVQRGTGSDPRA